MSLAIGGDWTTAKTADIQQFLLRWRDSRVALLRFGYQGLLPTLPYGLVWLRTCLGCNWLSGPAPRCFGVTHNASSGYISSGYASWLASLRRLATTTRTCHALMSSLLVAVPVVAPRSEILALAGLRIAIIEEGSLKTSSDFHNDEIKAYTEMYQEGALRTTKDGSISTCKGRTVGGHHNGELDQ